ncbi:ly6/PLAUR domain-containing protein 3 [Acomys russatus]|uniref:ly6/PLAUR domain-containing protein 3 n=1 Tax=Acomys russatus TaxID=60746 RepID=UPI0021E26C84|nr:ly6/PLAUR domain-containing protein 3 [Acomys russatus]
MDASRRGDTRTAVLSTRWLLLLLLPLLLLCEGAQALECYSCVQKADDGCSPHKMKTVKCGPGVDVCTEAVGAVETIHGQFSVAVRGCGSGIPGKNDRGLDLHGLLAFLQLQQCAEDRCNAKLNLTSRGLNPAGNESAYEPNGAECYSCVGLSREKCQGTMPPVVNCYNASGRVYKGCFDGNVTLTAANVTVSLPVRGCVQDETCTRDGVTGPGFTLSGSCCHGSRCNSDLRNRTYFSPRIPPLVLLPPPTTAAPSTRVQTSSSTPTTATPTPATSTIVPTTPASHTSPRVVEREGAQEEESRLTGGAAGHQDRSNMGSNPAKGGPQMPTNEGSAALGSGSAALLLTVVAALML